MSGRISLALAVMAGLLALSSAKAADLIRIAYDNRAQPPYYLGEGSEPASPDPGISIEIVKAAAAKAGLTPVFSRMPWLRCLESLQAGQVDAVVNASFEKDRLKYGVYPGEGDFPDHDLRIATMSYSFLRKKGSDMTWDGKQMSGVTAPIGVVHGYSVSLDLQRKNMPIEEGASADQVLKMLEAGRLQTVALSTLTARRVLAKGDFSTLELVDPPILTKDYYVMLNRDFAGADPSRAARFWSAIGEIREGMGVQLAAKYEQ